MKAAHAGVDAADAPAQFPKIIFLLGDHQFEQSPVRRIAQTEQRPLLLNDFCHAVPAVPLPGGVFVLGLLRAWISLRWIRITRASLMILAKALIESLTEHPTLRAKDRQIPALFSADIAIVAVIRSWRRNSCELRAKGEHAWNLMLAGPAVIRLFAAVAASLTNR